MPLPCPPEALDEFISQPTNAVEDSLRDLDSDILVLGAGGKMGLHACLMLHRALLTIDSPHRVIAVSRFGSVNAQVVFEQAGIATIACDLLDTEAVANLPGSQNIFFLAGIKFGTADRPDLLHQYNVEMPRLIANRYGNARIVALSTGCVYTPSPANSSGSTEDSPTDPPGDYAQSCLGREKAFSEAATSFGNRAVFIRLNYSIELRYGVLHDIAQLIVKDEPVDTTISAVNLIWQGDAVAQIIRARNLCTNPPDKLNVTGTDRLCVADLARELGQRLGKRPKIIGDSAEKVWLSDSSRACDLFGSPSVSLTEMLDWTAAWIQGEHPSLNKPTGFSKTDAKF